MFKLYAYAQPGNTSDPLAVMASSNCNILYDCLTTLEKSGYYVIVWHGNMMIYKTMVQGDLK